MAAINFRGSRADVSRIAQQLAGILSGREPDTLGIGRGFLLALGFAVLSSVKEAYVIKARGGTDAMGIKWPKLKPQTIANRRVGPGDIRSSALIREREKVRKRELARIKREFARQEGRLFERFLLSLDAKEARKRARQMASARATRATGLTKVQTLGARMVEILRDTGVLLNSLSPGRLAGEGANVVYSKPGGEGGQDQVVDVSPGELIAGTNVAYAATHQFGDPSRNIPRRQILPDNESQVPEVWWEDWLDIAVRSLEAGTRLLFAQGAR
jgi:hypothetical protein